MQIVVIGLGSMGKRRIRLLKQYINQVTSSNKKEWKIIGVDFSEERRKECVEKFCISTYSSLQEALNNNVDIECAIISTSPHTHSKIITDCLNADLHVFTEINLIADNYDDNIELAKRKQRVLFLSSTPIYQKEMMYIIDSLKKRQFKGTYRYHVGQYLPDWHPWENYQQFFVGRKDTNGCREIFAIELPWMIKAFGKIKNIQSIHNKTSQLAIDYDDSYHVLIEHETGVMGEMSVDIVIPKAERDLKIWEENYCISWNGTAESLIEIDINSGIDREIFLYDKVDHEEGYNEFIEENSYYEEIVNFLHCIDGTEKAKYSFEDDKITLKWIDEIEK